MEYVYAAMLLHKAGQKVTEDGVKKVLEAAGLKPDVARIKALVSALEGVDIDKVVKESAVVAPVAAAASHDSKPAKEEKKPEEEKKSEEQAAAGLGALFG